MPERTMQDSEDRPQRRSALVARELPRLQGSHRRWGRLYPLLVWEEQGRALPLWCRLHDKNVHCQKIAELASW